ncbi:MAG: hypothetical protein QM811_01610 [Pirellulales bacterium]
MSSSRVRRSLLLLALTLVVAGGCDRKPQPVPVSGNVTIDGKPLQGGYVRVIPTTGRLAYGVIDENGHYSLTTFTSGDGVYPGEHTVEIAGYQDKPGKRTWLAPPYYKDEKLSNLTAKIDGPREDLNFELTWKNAKEAEPFDEIVPKE